MIPRLRHRSGVGSPTKASEETGFGPESNRRELFPTNSGKNVQYRSLHPCLVAVLCAILLLQLAIFSACGVGLWYAVRLFDGGHRSHGVKLLESAGILGTKFFLDRLFIVEMAPSMARVLVDVSSRGEVRTMYAHMREKKELREEQKLVIEIGANDGFQGSQSFNFLQLGWFAALVEPQPGILAEAQRNIQQLSFDNHHNAILRQVGVSGFHDGSLDLCIKGGAGATSSSFARSCHSSETTVSVSVESVKTLMTGLNQELRNTRRSQVWRREELSPFADNPLPRCFGVLSVDAEGFEAEILHGFVAEGFLPVYIVAEDTGVPGDHNHKLMLEANKLFDQILLPHGYTKLAHISNNQIYYRSPLTGCNSTKPPGGL